MQDLSLTKKTGLHRVFSLFLFTGSLFLFSCSAGRLAQFQSKIEKRLQYKEYYKDFIGNLFGYACFLDKNTLIEIQRIFCEKKLCSNDDLEKRINKIKRDDYLVFYVALYTKNPKWNNLDAGEKSVFKVALKTGLRLIKPVKIVDAQKYSFIFPVDRAFFRSYFVYFPKITPDGSPIKLVVGGIPGEIEFVWKKIH